MEQARRGQLAQQGLAAGAQARRRRQAVTPYSLHHPFASWRSREGLPITGLAEQMGHSPLDSGHMAVISHPRQLADLLNQIHRR